MKKKILWAFLAMGAGCAILLNACSEKDILTEDSSLLTSAADESQMASISDDVVNTTEQYITALSLTGYKSSSPPLKATTASTVSSISVIVDKPDSTNFPKVVTINFGTTGFTGQRGNTYTGILIVTINNKLSVVDASYTIRSNNFYVNGNKVGFLKTVTYTGTDANNYPSWSIVTNDTIVRANNTTVTCHSERTREQIDNNQTPNIPWDDTFAIRGTADGTNSKGNTYQMAIDSNNPLIVTGSCPYIEKGSAVITVGTKAVVIDYGNGTCDDTATATANSITKTFTLSN